VFDFTAILKVLLCFYGVVKYFFQVHVTNVFITFHDCKQVFNNNKTVHPSQNKYYCFI